MPLFDLEIERRDTGPAKYAEPTYAYLNRSARPEAVRIRDLLEAWYARLPEQMRGELLARFRSPDSVHHDAAFFELYLHELLHLLGYSVEIHPSVPGSERHPDFLASRQDEASFYLEGAVATNKSREEIAAEARLSQVYDALNLVTSPNFFIGAEVSGTPSSPVPGRLLRPQVEQFLAQHDPDHVASLLQAGGLDALPRGTFSHDGWTIEFYPLPKSPAARGDLSVRPLGVLGPGEAYWVDNRTALRDAVVRKATHYGEMDRPFIVAVNAIDQHLDQIDVMEALFGKETFVVTPGPDGWGGEPEMRRELDGAWIHRAGPVNTRVSAVLVISSLKEWSIGAYSPTVYHNPWAKYPCRDALSTLHSAHPVDNQMRVRQGTHFGRLAKLPEGWPAQPSA